MAMSLLFFTLLALLLGSSSAVNSAILDMDGPSLVSSAHHICAIESQHGVDVGGRVFCWSENPDHDHIINADVEQTFIQIAGGIYSTCGIALDQTVTCWGQGKTTVPGLFTQISVHTLYGCGIRIDGSIYCWGFSDVVKALPKYPDTLKFVQISCAQHHCCALDEEAFPHCFGLSDKHGETSPPFEDDYVVDKDYEDEEEEEDYDEDIEEKLERQKGKAHMKFRQVTVGELYSCGITMNNDLTCWGEHRVVKRTYPKFVKGPFKQVSMGSMGICALRAGNDEDMENQEENEQKDEESEEESVVVEKSSQASTKTNEPPPHSMECWGVANLHIPQEDKMKEWDQIKLGDGGVCAVSMDSDLQCWGSSVFQKLPSIVVA